MDIVSVRIVLLMVDIKSQIEDYLELLDMTYTWNSKKKYFELVFIIIIVKEKTNVF